MAEKGEALSDRELEVLQCVIDGAVNKEIATALTISQNTVKVHLRNIYTKLGVSSRTEATTVALQQGLVTLAGVTTEGNEASAVETAVAGPVSDTVPEEALPQPASRPAFFPRRLGALALVALAAAIIFVTIRLVAQSIAPAEEPFVETPLSDDWLQSRALPASRSHMALVGSGLNLYLIGGQSNAAVTADVSIFETSTLIWRAGAPKPTAVTEVTGAELFGEIYVAGGRLENGQPTDVVEVYSPANNSWRLATSLPTPVTGGLALSDGSFLYLFGGWDGQNYLADAYRFDPATNSWQILPGMETPRAYATGGVIKGKLYVVGGYDGERPLTECAHFDPTPANAGGTGLNGQWQPCADTLLPRAGAGAAGLLNKLYVFGGGAFGSEPITYSESYNPDADEWSIVNTPPLAETANWANLGIANIETKIYAVGGSRGEEETAETYVYRPLVYQTFIPIAPVDSGGP